MRCGRSQAAGRAPSSGSAARRKAVRSIVPPDSRQGICGSVFVACHVLTSNRNLRSRAMLHLREIPPVRAWQSLPQRQPSLCRWCRGLVNGRHAATHVGLYRRARHRSVRAKHAAIAREGLEPFAAPFAVIEELAGIGRHRLDGLMAAFRASQDGLKLHIGSCFALATTMFSSILRSSGSRRITKRGPFQSSIDLSPTRMPFSLCQIADMVAGQAVNTDRLQGEFAT